MCDTYTQDWTDYRSRTSHRRKTLLPKLTLYNDNNNNDTRVLYHIQYVIL